jgi:hypothetical protein
VEGRMQLGPNIPSRVNEGAIEVNDLFFLCEMTVSDSRQTELYW